MTRREMKKELQEVVEKCAPPTLEFSKNQIFKQFINRLEDVKNNLFQLNANEFREYSKKRTNEEIENAKALMY